MLYGAAAPLKRLALLCCQPKALPGFPSPLPRGQAFMGMTGRADRFVC